MALLQLGLVTLLLHVAKSYTLPSARTKTMHNSMTLGNSKWTPMQQQTKYHRISRLQLQALASPDDFLHLQNLLLSFNDLISTHSNEPLNHPDILTTTSNMIADATATDPTEQSWWDTYLNGIKSSISFVHTVIDQPLRNAGFDQTWGLAIFLFTAGVRSLLVPLSIQQVKSTEYMKALKPYQDEIKAKFKGNKDMINRATAKLFEDTKTNPLAGCLVSILQLPIFLGLYRGVNLLAKEGNLDEPFLFIPSLEGPVSPPDFRGLDWITAGWHTGLNGLPEPGLGWSATLAFLVMPVVLVLGQSFTMSALSPAPDETASSVEKEQYEKTQGILKFLPLMIGYFSLQVPAGLTIYWFTSNLFTLVQSLSVRGYYKANPPKIELPDYWGALDKDNAENMTPDDRREAAKAGLSVGPKMEDMLDEARYHVFIERKSLRQDSVAWQRALKNGKPIPPEMLSWVNGEVSESRPTKVEVEGSLKEMPVVP